MDLIIVVDVSSSMKGQKLNLVIKNLKFIINELKNYDRICLIKFSTRSHILGPLTPMTPENKSKMLKTVA